MISSFWPLLFVPRLAGSTTATASTAEMMYAKIVATIDPKIIISSLSFMCRGVSFKRTGAYYSIFTILFQVENNKVFDVRSAWKEVIATVVLDCIFLG